MGRNHPPPENAGQVICPRCGRRVRASWNGGDVRAIVQNHADARGGPLPDLFGNPRQPTCDGTAALVPVPA